MFWIRTKTEVCPTSWVLMIYPAISKISQLCPDGDTRGDTTVSPFFLCYLTIYKKKEKCLNQ